MSSLLGSWLVDEMSHSRSSLEDAYYAPGERGSEISDVLSLGSVNDGALRYPILRCGVGQEPLDFLKRSLGDHMPLH